MQTLLHAAMIWRVVDASCGDHMPPTEFSIFKYQHADPASLGPRRQLVVYLGLVLAVFVTVLKFPHGAWLFFLPLVAYLSAGRQLLLGPRYLLCGKTIVYYGNVKHLTLSPVPGTLRVQSANGHVFVLERDKFPTGARKAEKIAKNKAAKFDKVCAKIVEKVLSAGAEVELVGIRA